ncbi:diiron oxygenase [Pseudomonas vancouverensis]|uniref:Aminobenzoate oxygenase n=1 Tax=Pseudomonas vancouverensis TaxID=95300 RepID=A0A1H2P9G3_PSEVA|nr:diiron oxygenase [Pseudomonas vancouverensis]KAB0500312.1 diiron oxygenase [Pseudomonas vancouverensis]TDB58944.1 aminobenzoate oxygenase [Pseudomonas vancouverensis]SDV14001.1 P-aminobenzoate N-oxygenase AurF [Pseudomonas vancouverensis]
MQTAIEIATVDHQLIIRLNQAWTKRATVCSPERAQVNEVFDPARPDYPQSMVPFFHHPAFQALSEALKSNVITWGWIGYNLRTVTAEEHVVNPALSVIANQYLGKDDWHFREAMQQTLVDEHYHTLMHLRAIERTKVERELDQDLDLPPSVTYLRLKALHEELPEQWQRDLAAITFAVVAEISVNAYLDLLADDQTIQPQNRRVAELHNRDEYAHSKVLAEVAKVMYGNMQPAQQAFFARTLSVALSAFVAQDYSMWEAILTQLGVAEAAQIIADTKESNKNATIMRDYSGLHKLAQELGISEQIDFDFRPTLKTAAA